MTPPVYTADHGVPRGFKESRHNQNREPPSSDFAPNSAGIATAPAADDTGAPQLGVSTIADIHTGALPEPDPPSALHRMRRAMRHDLLLLPDQPGQRMQASLSGKRYYDPNKDAFFMKDATLLCPYAVQPFFPAHRLPKQYRFLDFPPEIRNHIYDYACRYPDCRSLYSHYNSQIDEYYAARKAGNEHVSFPVWKWCVKRFTILLLCKQITRECRPFLDSRFLLIDRIPPFPHGAIQPLPLASFITQHTLQSLKRLELRFTIGQGKLGSGFFWYTFLQGIFDILVEKNSLVELRIILSMAGLGDAEAWVDDHAYLDKLRFKIQELRTGDGNPFGALVMITTETWLIEGLEANRIRHSLLDSTPAPRHARTPVPSTVDVRKYFTESVSYPNERIWPGGILEFL
ncbi:hypothetical protein GE09DRAFT_659188 [Coniochaeta sp. 2T2.1]|nr:hypothetical protein GE09DRAFT_659188 [Coniochaeta sp. 2T2.1]